MKKALHDNAVYAYFRWCYWHYASQMHRLLPGAVPIAALLNSSLDPCVHCHVGLLELSDQAPVLKTAQPPSQHLQHYHTCFMPVIRCHDVSNAGMHPPAHAVASNCNACNRKLF